MLVLDHLILRSPAPDATFAQLAEAGLPVLAPPTDVAGGAMRSGLLRAGDVDIEVLGVGADGPAAVEGYGIGLAAVDEPLAAVAARLRAAGLPTSPPLTGRAEGRTWRVLHVAGLLPDPFSAPFSLQPPGRAERLLAGALDAVGRVPAVARAATRRAGRSMVVVTRYDFDVAAWRASVDRGPAVTGVELGIGGAADAWASLGTLGGPPLRLDPDGEPGVRRVTLDGAAGLPLRLGAVSLDTAR